MTAADCRGVIGYAIVRSACWDEETTVKENKAITEGDEVVPQKFAIRRKYLIWLSKQAKARHVPASTILDEVLDRWIADREKPTTPKTPMTGHELLQEWTASGLIGIWRDRADIGDSVEYARSLRETVWKRQHDWRTFMRTRFGSSVNDGH
jgi:hypothetical protein